jgi:hypothetical protein
MPSMMESLAGQLLKGQLPEITQQLGADEQSTGSALSAALPLLMGALARNASKPEGAESLIGALQKKHDGGVLDDLTAHLRKPDLDDGNGILRHMLGDRRGSVEQGISKTSGLDAAKVSKMLGMLAPVVMGALGKAARKDNMDAGSLSGMLGKEHEEMKKAVPQMDVLGKLLDWDGDGEVASDLLGGVAKGMLGKIFGGGR